MKNQQLYAIRFDNDPDFPGVLQWVNIGDEWGATNISASFEDVLIAFNDAASQFPHINYKIVQLEPTQIY